MCHALEGLRGAPAGRLAHVPCAGEASRGSRGAFCACAMRCSGFAGRKSIYQQTGCGNVIQLRRDVSKWGFLLHLFQCYIVVLAVVCFPKYVDKRKAAQHEVKAKLIEATQHHMKEVCGIDIEAVGVSFGGIVQMTWELATRNNQVGPVHGYVYKHTIVLVIPGECPRGEDYYLLGQSINRFIPAPALLSDLNEDPFPSGMNQDLGYLFQLILYFRCFDCIGFLLCTTSTMGG
ncbi:MAG: hypothetical protein J7639_18145 [Paenibacillaceae bacterium]|nr:hypothetical protein [Paenibacillaceae bacterium]